MTKSDNEGFRKLVESDFQKDDTTSYVVFSDNHNCNDYSLKEFQTWIKGDLSYETLRLSFSDPDSRIHTSKKKPTHTPNYIDKLNLIIKDQEPIEISFSPFLNVIIGGRSSGKSLLFNTILGLNNFLGSDDIKLYDNIYSEFIDLKKTMIKDSNSDYVSKISIEAEAYFQEKIIQLFNDGIALKDKLLNFFNEFNEIEIASEELKVEKIFNVFSESYKDYYNCVKTINKGMINNTLKNANLKSKKLFGINNNFCNEVLTGEYDKVINYINESLNQLNFMTKLKINGNNVFSDLEIEEINKTIKILSNKVTQVKALLKKIILKNKFIDKLKSILDKYIREELAQELQQIEHAKEKLEKDLIDYKSFFKAKFQLRKACTNIEKISIKVIDKVNKDGKYSFVSKLNFEINQEIIIEELFIQSINNYEKGVPIYKNICNMADPLTDVRIKRKVNDGKYPETFKQKITEFVENKKSKKEFVIVENGDIPVSSDSTSQGKKASMFLDIKLNGFLSGNKVCVLLVDQIEDNIDNKYIGKDLVTSLRALKKQIQIILVTHNPSIAIYGDAENIIIAENLDGNFKFTQGGLENDFIRKESCRILDGGDIAFKNRMDKYNIAKVK